MIKSVRDNLMGIKRLLASLKSDVPNFTFEYPRAGAQYWFNLDRWGDTKLDVVVSLKEGGVRFVKKKRNITDFYPISKEYWIMLDPVLLQKPIDELLPIIRSKLP